MFRRLVIATVLMASTAGLASAQTRVTFVMRNGERIVGDLTYKGGADYTLNGRDISASDVAVIAFAPGDPSPQELSRIPTVDNNPSELDAARHARRSMVFSKPYKLVRRQPHLRPARRRAPRCRGQQYDANLYQSRRSARGLRFDSRVGEYVLTGCGRNVRRERQNPRQPAVGVHGLQCASRRDASLQHHRGSDVDT